MKPATLPAGAAGEANAAEPRPRRPNAPARPTYLNPLKVKLPVTATVSLGHRISGLLLVLALPLLLWGLGRSLAGDAGYAQVRAALAGWPGRMLMLVLTWAMAHHVIAGVRHLVFDAGIGTQYRMARRTAWAVHALVAVVVALVAVVTFMPLWSAGSAR